jgi:hypothetical protein
LERVRARVSQPERPEHSALFAAAVFGSQELAPVPVSGLRVLEWAAQPQELESGLAAGTRALRGAPLLVVVARLLE